MGQARPMIVTSLKRVEDMNSRAKMLRTQCIIKQFNKTALTILKQTVIRASA